MLRKLLVRFVHEDQGQDLIEYAFLAVFIGLAVTIGLQSVATGVNNQMSKIGTQAPPQARDLLYWNVWAETNPGSHLPVNRLRPGTTYALPIHVGALPYSDESSVKVAPVGFDLSSQFAEWTRPGGPRETRLQLLALPDERFFKLIGERARPVSVDLSVARAWMTEPAQPDQPTPFRTMREAMASGSRVPYLFGSLDRPGQVFMFSTTDREGLGTITLSVWTNLGRPIDEFSVDFCVTTAPPEQDVTACVRDANVQDSLAGVDSLRVATDDDVAPDAALHIVELDERGLVGVFRERCDGCGYSVWELGLDSATFRRYLDETALAGFGPAVATTSLTRAGQGLYRLLFPDDRADARQARRAFLNFVRPSLAASDAPTMPKSLFVRTVLGKSVHADPLHVPLGLLVVPELGGSPFLGLRVRIETPLERQSYSASTACVSRWFLAVPPEGHNPELTTARRRAGEHLERWSKSAVDTFDTIGEFGAWLSRPHDDLPRPAPPDESNSALVILSHQTQNQIFFSSNERLTPTNAERTFESSVVILDGCSTASPTSVGFVRRFNQLGIATVVGSHVAVTPEMAGDFLKSLGETLDEVGGVGDAIGNLFFRSIVRLGAKRPSDTAEPYGGRALVFSLFGNGALRLCSPRSDPR